MEQKLPSQKDAMLLYSTLHITVYPENEGGGYREGKASRGERERQRGRIKLCILDWYIPAFGGGGPYMHVNSCCILYWGCYLIPNEWTETDVALQIMLVLICMLPEECAHNRQGALTTVQLSALSSTLHFKHLWKAACTDWRTLLNKQMQTKSNTQLDSPLVWWCLCLK